MKINATTIRGLLKPFFHEHYYQHQPWDEVGICGGEIIADVVVTETREDGSVHFHGYEIKSDVDTLSRLPKQIDYYDRVFDTNTLVVGEKLLEPALDILPDSWGLILVLDHSHDEPCDPDNLVCQPKLHVIRCSRRNRNLRPFSFSQFLWRDEAYAFLRERGLSKGLSSARRRKLWSLIAKEIPISEIKAQTLSAWRSRDRWKR